MPKRGPEPDTTLPPGGPMRLNKYIARSGYCSRREADVLIAEGKVQVNGSVVTAMGHKVDPAKDKVSIGGKTLEAEPLVYVLLNKPKDTLTTAKDPEGRRTVLDLVAKATPYRVYPVGRLDRHTTGVLLLTNDGELAKKLSHPSSEVSKLYHIELDRPVLPEHVEALREGIQLDDGPIQADAIDYVQGGQPNQVGVELHSGRNRIVRRMFEHFSYKVQRLDRVAFAGLTKKGLKRGHFRQLSPKEVGFLKMLDK